MCVSEIVDCRWFEMSIEVFVKVLVKIFDVEILSWKIMIWNKKDLNNFIIYTWVIDVNLLDSSTTKERWKKLLIKIVRKWLLDKFLSTTKENCRSNDKIASGRFCAMFWLIVAANFSRLFPVFETLSVSIITLKEMFQCLAKLYNVGS